MSENYSEIQSALSDYLKAWTKLKDLKVLNNKKDFTSQLSEFIVATIYKGKPSINSTQKHWDIELSDGRKVQVKSHAKASSNKTSRTPVPYLEDSEIDLYIIVVFTEEYKLKHFFEITWKELWVLSNIYKTKRVVTWKRLGKFDKANQKEFRENDLIKLFIQ